MGNSSMPPAKKRREARSPEAKEKELISLAMDEAERRIRDHTVSSQVLTHFIKAGSRKEELDREINELNKKLIQAKTDALKSEGEAREIASKAIAAMKLYTGGGE